MSSTVGTMPAVRATARTASLTNDRRFYTGMSIAALVTVIAGFSPTYYLKAFTSAPVLPPLVHVHGVVFSMWIVLFVAQTTLVAAGRTALHRRLGVGGGVLAGLMVAVGLMTAIAGGRRGFNPPAAGMPDALAFLAIPIRDLMVFSVIVSLALYYRRAAATHKRLMLLATINILPAAITRIPLSIAFPPFIPILIVSFLLAGPIYDYASRRRVHPVYIWGGLVTFATIGLQFAIGPTGAWHTFASWLIRYV